MMRALGSDLLELISTVAEETTHITDIVQIYREELFAEELDDDSYDHYESDDENCDTSDDDDEDEIRSQDGFIDRISSSERSIRNNTDVTFHATKNEQTPVDRELERRRNDPQNYLEPLPCVEEAIYTVPLHMANQDECHDGDLELTVLVGDICNNRDCDENCDNNGGDGDQRREMEEYLRSFDIYERTEEIARQLRANGELEDIFHRIVPLEVSYTDFWKRFFYRCDRTRIERELMTVHGIAASILTPVADNEAEMTPASRRIIQDHGTDNNKAATAPPPPSSPKSVLKTVQWDDVPSYHPPKPK